MLRSKEDAGPEQSFKLPQMLFSFFSFSRLRWHGFWWGEQAWETVITTLKVGEVRYLWTNVDYHWSDTTDSGLWTVSVSVWMGELPCCLRATVDCTRWNVCEGVSGQKGVLWLSKGAIEEELINVPVNILAAFHCVLDLSWSVCSRIAFLCSCFRNHSAFFFFLSDWEFQKGMTFLHVLTVGY